MADNRAVQAMRERSRVSLEKSARNAGVKNIAHKNKLELARDIDRARKDKRNGRARANTAGRKHAKKPEKKRGGLYYPRNRTRTFWDAYREAMQSLKRRTMKITKYDPQNPDLSDCRVVTVRPVTTSDNEKKLCRRCLNNPIESKGNAAKYCNDCRAADPHRHAGRKAEAFRGTITTNFSVTIERRPE